MDRPSGETGRERKVHDLSCGMKVVITASLVSLRTLAALVLPRLSVTTTRPKRPSSTPAVGDGVAVVDGDDDVADGVPTATVGEDGVFATG
jgi:hypothetical protein